MSYIGDKRLQHWVVHFELKVLRKKREREAFFLVFFALLFLVSITLIPLQEF